MTPPMTPREKVRQIIDDALNSAIPEPWEVANHATDRILTALVSGSGDHSGDLTDMVDHAELAAKAERCTTGDPWYTDDDLRGRQSFGQFLPQDRAFIAAANPATVLALLAENAALRERLETARIARAAHNRQHGEAERQRDEAVGLLEQFHTRILMERRCNSLGTNVAEPIMEKTRAFLANQGADQ